MPFSGTAEAQSLDALSATGTPTNIVGWASLHSAYSATGTGGTELSGGGYSRVAVSWNAASSSTGTKALATGTYTFTIPSTASLGSPITVAFIGLWSASSGGTFAGMGANGGNSYFAYTCTGVSPAVFTAPGIGTLAAGTPIVLWQGPGGVLPTPTGTWGSVQGGLFLVAASPAPSANTFCLAAYPGGGAALNATNPGSGMVQAVSIETYTTSTGTFTLNADTLQIA